MAKQKKLTMQDYFGELERVCRIITERKVEEGELVFFRKALQHPLDEISKMRKIKYEEAERKKAEKIKAENERRYGRNLDSYKWKTEDIKEDY